MARPPLEDRSAVRDSVLTLRLADVDRAALDALIQARRVELAPEGVDVTAASVVRWLLRTEAKRRGLLSDQGGKVSRRAPRASAKVRRLK